MGMDEQSCGEKLEVWLFISELQLLALSIVAEIADDSILVDSAGVEVVNVSHRFDLEESGSNEGSQSVAFFGGFQVFLSGLFPHDLLMVGSFRIGGLDINGGRGHDLANKVVPFLTNTNARQRQEDIL